MVNSLIKHILVLIPIHGHPLFALCLSLLMVPAVHGEVLRLDTTTRSVVVSPYLLLLEEGARPRSVEEVTTLPAAEWRTGEGQQPELNLGYTNSAWWLRLDVESGAAYNGYLELAYPPLDAIELFYAARTGGDYLHLKGGDAVAFSERPLPYYNHLFPISLPAGKSTLYLRVSSAGSLTLPISLWAEEAFVWHSQRSYAVLALYYGILLALGAYNLMLYFSLREAVYREYVLFLAAMAVGIGSLNGLAAQFLFSDSPRVTDAALLVGMALAGLLAARFVRAFLDTKADAPRIDRLLLLFVVWYALSVAVVFISKQSAEQMISLASLLFAPFAWWVGLRYVRTGHPGARYFLMAWSVLLIGSMLLAARNFDWVPSNMLTTYGLQMGSVLEMILLSFALADRINTLRREKDASQQQLLQAQEESVQLLRKSEQELEVRILARTNELNEANRRLEMLMRRDPLTGLGNRNELEITWGEMAKRVLPDSRHALLLLDLNGFKPVNDNYGHHVGDEVLKEIGGRLRQLVRTGDSVIRLGGDEFVILLDNLRSRDHLPAILEKIRNEITRPITLGDLRLEVGTSIGVAMFPEQGESLESLLRVADAEMYRMKRGTR